MVAVNGVVTGRNLPLIVISHGSGGWFGDYPDTAQALAEAGFVVVALTHPGDNYKEVDDNGLHILINRPHQIHRVLDYMTRSWQAHDHINSSEIGIFGFSAGGYTSLVAIGGVPDWKLVAPHCSADPEEAVCHQGLAAVFSRPTAKALALPETTWQHDPRIFGVGAMPSWQRGAARCP